MTVSGTLKSSFRRGWYTLVRVRLPSERGQGAAVRARAAYANVISKGTRGGTGAYGGGWGQRSEGTELEFDPWCSRWDAILFIVLIISEYIVRTRHAAPRSRMREIYAIETTPSPPPPPAGPYMPCTPFLCTRVHASSFFHCRSPPGGPPSRPSIRTRVLTRVICAASK